MEFSNNFVRNQFKFNLVVNVLDGAFFGFALGFASFTTILPLFVSRMTDSALLVGLIPGLHVLGWQLPQLFTASHITKLSRLKPYVLLMSMQERWPYLGFALVAWFLPSLGTSLGLAITFILLIIQGIGSGMAANGWQNLISRVIPSENRGAFFGIQSAASNLLSSLGAILAGLILSRMNGSNGFAICFLIATASFMVSWIFLGSTREAPTSVPVAGLHNLPILTGIKTVLKRDRNFLWFLIARSISQFGLMGFAFYIVYAARAFGISEVTAGLMTSVLLITQVTANPLLGWIADRTSRKLVLEAGAASALLSSLLAAFAPGAGWFFLVFILAGLANTAFWTIGIAISLEFGKEADRPTYVGMANTLIAPSSLLAPLLGGWLADSSTYQTTFLMAAAAAFLTVITYQFFVCDPKSNPNCED